MRVGVIGVGEMGQNHVRIYHELGAEIVGISDIDEKRATSISRQYGTMVFPDYTELLNQDLDAVSIVVPTTIHHEVALRAIARGVNMLVEKPLADTIAYGKEMVEAAEKAGLKLMVGHIERFNPAVQKLKQILDDDILGELISMTARRVGPFVPRVNDTGIIVDVATHDIDIIRYLAGRECTSISARSIGRKNMKGDAALILLGFGELGFGDMLSASVEVNWHTPHKVRTLTVTGTKGIAYLDYIKQEIEIYTAEWKMVPKVDKEEPLKMEIQHFIGCIERDEQPLVSGQDGLRVLEIAIQAEECANKI